MLANDKQVQYVVLTDRAGEDAGKRCPVVCGFVPDVYAVAVRDSQQRTIGEAKSSFDLETAHTQLQLKAFIRHLSIFERPTLILATSFSALPRAISLLSSLLPGNTNVCALAIAPSLRRTVTVGWQS